MRGYATAEEIEQYQRDGFVVLCDQQDVYTAEEAARLQVGDPLADPALNPLVYPVAAGG